MAGPVIRDMVRNYLSARAAKDILESNVKVSLHVMVHLCHFYLTENKVTVKVLTYDASISISASI